MRNIKDFYIYESTVASLANGANDTNNVNIEADSDFILQKLVMFADIAGAVQTDSSRVLPLIKIQITDTGSGRQLFSDDIPMAMILGSGSLPFILPNPRRFASNSVISIAYNNYSAATTYVNIYIGFVGLKDYKLSH